GGARPPGDDRQADPPPALDPPARRGPPRGARLDLARDQGLTSAACHAGPMRVLVVNAGSATLKLATVEVAAGGGGEPVGTGDVLVDPWDGGDAGVAESLPELGPVHAVGHRVVHGGADLVAPALLDHEVVT